MDFLFGMLFVDSVIHLKVIENPYLGKILKKVMPKYKLPNRHKLRGIIDKYTRSVIYLI